MYFGLGSAWTDNKAEGTWDIKNYTSGHEVKFSKTEAEGKQVNGSDVTDSSLTEINPEQVKQFIFGGIQKIMKEYDENFLNQASSDCSNSYIKFIKLLGISLS